MAGYLALGKDHHVKVAPGPQYLYVQIMGLGNSE